MQSNHDDFCLHVVQSKTQQATSGCHTLGADVHWIFGRGLRISFPVWKRSKKIEWINESKKLYRNCLCFWRVWTLTSSQDILYSAKTVRQRAAILREQRSKKKTNNNNLSQKGAIVVTLKKNVCIASAHKAQQVILTHRKGTEKDTLMVQQLVCVSQQRREL